MVKQIIKSILVGYVINKGIVLLGRVFDGNSNKGITKYKRSNNEKK